MDILFATEQAYKNGFKAGVDFAIKSIIDRDGDPEVVDGVEFYRVKKSVLFSLIGNLDKNGSKDTNL